MAKWWNLVLVPALVMVMVMVTACGSSKDTKKPPAPIPTCREVAARMVDHMPKDAPEVQEKLRAAIEPLCDDDKWSDDARRCFATVNNTDEVGQCRTRLGNSQNDALEHAIATITAPPPPPSALRVTSIDPPKGDVEGGTFVVIKGSNFMKAGPRNVKAYFGSRQGTIVRFQSDTELVVQAPGGKPGEAVDVLLIFEPGGQQKLPNAFTFVEK